MGEDYDVTKLCLYNVFNSFLVILLTFPYRLRSKFTNDNSSNEQS